MLAIVKNAAGWRSASPTLETILVRRARGLEGADVSCDPTKRGRGPLRLWRIRPTGIIPASWQGSPTMSHPAVARPARWRSCSDGVSALRLSSPSGAAFPSEAPTSGSPLSRRADGFLAGR